MSKMSFYGPNVIVVQEKWTRRGGRFEIKRPEGTNIFEFDDSSERGDQLRNACFLAQQFINVGRENGKIMSAAFQPEGKSHPGRTSNAINEHGQIMLEGAI